MSDIAERFGSQSVVVSIDVKRDWLGRYRLWHASSRSALNVDWLATMKTLVQVGAGEECCSTPVDRDGMQQGFDLPLIQSAAQAVDVPLIALGGASAVTDFVEAVAAGASAVAAGSLFVLQGQHRAVLISYPNYSELESLFRGNNAS